MSFAFDLHDQAAPQPEYEPNAWNKPTQVATWVAEELHDSDEEEEEEEAAAAAGTRDDEGAWGASGGAC
jgi:hypothetical protein